MYSKTRKPHPFVDGGGFSLCLSLLGRSAYGGGGEGGASPTDPGQ